MTWADVPCTRLTRNNPGCRCDRCIERRRRLKRERRHSAAIAKVRAMETHTRAALWEGIGRRE